MTDGTHREDAVRRGAAGVVGAIAFTMLVAWLAGLEGMLGAHSLAPMSPLACVAFGAAAAGVARIPRGRAVPVASGLITLTCGILGLADTQLWSGVAVNETLFSVTTPISTLTSVALVLLGAAVALDGANWAVTRWLAAAAAAIGCAAAIGFVLGVPLFYGATRSVEMSWQAALSTLLVALGVGAAHPAGIVERLLCDGGLGGRFARRTLPAVIGIPVLAGAVATALARAGWWSFYVAAWVMTLAAVAGLAVVATMAAERLADDDTRLTELAIRDPLTGAYNRRHFVAEAAQAASRAQRYGETAAIAVVDLDHFKEINDRWGHAAGDEALVRVYRSLRARLRSTDVLGRIGGDEFAAVILHVDELEVGRIVQAMRGAVEGVADELAAEGRPTRLAASVGVAALDPDDPREVAALLDLADRRMYRDKRSRRTAQRASARSSSSNSAAN
jgi:diguanylate cyclase (GGDEF)-like protein